MKNALLFLAVLLLSLPVDAARPAAERPYRVLLVIGDQWNDPGSYNIQAAPVRSPAAPVSAKDFVDVATMLKIWGIPFDVLRLDEQRLQINRFLNGMAEPAYGCIVWMADPDKLEGYSAHYETLRRAVEGYGISLIALFDHIRAPAVAALAGVDYDGASAREEPATLAVTGSHFITAGLAGKTIAGGGARTVRCRARPGTHVLGTVGGQPQLVARDVNAETKAVWIGGGRDWFDRAPEMRALFRKALVWSMGYGLFNDSLENTFILIMDDMGTSEHAYSLRWHYPTPGKATIMKTLVEPLSKRGLVIVQNVCSGYANPATRMVENPWTVPRFTDPFGNVQDYGSTKQGLDEGLRRGVFEIQAHRAWTHLNWDLDSPPGPWWDAPIEGERAHNAWYNEVWDFRREKPVPPNDLLFTYRIGRDAIERQFGVTPLGVTLRHAPDLVHSNGRLAAIAGYGVGRFQYIGRDRVIHFSIPAMAPEEVGCHDIDILARRDSEITGSAVRSAPPEKLRAAPIVGQRAPFDMTDPNWPDRWKHKRWIGFNEYSAYLHSRVGASVSAEGLAVDLDYDPHYCRHFAGKPSQWTLELSERYLKKYGRAGVTVDGKPAARAASTRTVLTIPAGAGRHRIALAAR